MLLVLDKLLRLVDIVKHQVSVQGYLTFDVSIVNLILIHLILQLLLSSLQLFFDVHLLYELSDLLSEIR